MLFGLFSGWRGFCHGTGSDLFLFVPRLSRKRGILKLIRPSVCPSVCQSLCHKNFNLAHIFWSINDRALIFGMHDPCDKPFLLIPCSDLDLWPTPRSNLLPGGGPQFFEFACSLSIDYSAIRWCCVESCAVCFELVIANVYDLLRSRFLIL